jgi:hypothetical protein
VSTGTPIFHHVAALVDRGEERHQQDGHDDAGAGEHVLAAAHLHPVVGERVVLPVLDDRHHLDRRDRRRLQPGEPPERGSDGAAERVVGEARGAAGDRIHGAELGVDEREQQDRQGADAPGDDRRRAGRPERPLRAEEPARADDRASGRPQQPDEPDLPS